MGEGAYVKNPGYRDFLPKKKNPGARDFHKKKNPGTWEGVAPVLKLDRRQGSVTNAKNASPSGREYAVAPLPILYTEQKQT